MSERLLRNLMGGLRRVVRPHEAGALGDADLVRRWVTDRDAAAFEVLLWRHGPLVLGLCRRMLCTIQDVEDAFQSTFLALARQAHSIGKREAVACWLYKVAYRAALRARTGAVRWQPLDPEALDTAAVDPAREAAGRELRAVLDEEMSRLPNRYRAPLVLCYFEGRTNEEAARELGCPVGTVASRLARGRQRLRVRLARRGLAPAALGATALPSAATVPAALVASTGRVALLGAGGKAIQGVLSARVVALTEGVIRAMKMTRMKMTAAVFLAVALAGAGGGIGYKALASGQVGSGPALAPQRPPGGGGNFVPLKPPPAVDADPLAHSLQRLAEAQAAVEEAQAEHTIRKAQLDAARANLAFSKAQLARMEQLFKSGAVDVQIVLEKQATTQSAEAAVRVAEAQLTQGAIRLREAQRRLAVIQGPKPLPRVPGPLSPEERLKELEKKLDALRKEVDDLRRELRLKKSGTGSTGDRPVPGTPSSR